MSEQLIETMNAEIEKMADWVIQNERRLPMDKFIESIMGGGLAEIIEHNGGRILSFIIQNKEGEAVPLHDFQIPDLGGAHNLRGFLLSANDGSETLNSTELKDIHVFSTELNIFFEGLYVTIMSTIESGNQVSVVIKETPKS
ncbi:MAG: hypothetical protein L0154_06170 [Chloroflexi bacterium]|nr:hypothetical protein [Chloroflexota bacterium]